MQNAKKNIIPYPHFIPSYQESLHMQCKTQNVIHIPIRFHASLAIEARCSRLRSRISSYNLKQMYVISSSIKMDVVKHSHKMQAASFLQTPDYDMRR